MKKISIVLAIFVYLALVYSGSAIECLDCHSGAWGPIVNSSVFGFHKDINKSDGGLTSNDCQACHYSANTSVFHGEGVEVPTYTCEYCHIGDIVPDVPKVYNHNKTSNISVNITCGDCHNKTSNLFIISDNPLISSVNASAAHYGRNASFGISPGEAYCAYCHANSTTVYRDVMQNPKNAMLRNHTSGIMNASHYAGRPDCTTCHWTDRIHGTNLTKPVPNSGFCNNCHQNDRMQKDRHAGKVECILCHAENDSDIHNIQYLLQDKTYRSVNATSCINCHDGDNWPTFKLPFSTADCTTCHLGNGVSKFAEAPRFPSPMTHSSNPASGGLWNGPSPAYWDTQVNACKYCHGENKLHDTNPLGKVSNIKFGNALNQSITNTSFWCANCHYKDGDMPGNYTYNATSYDPEPPEIQNKSGNVPAQAVRWDYFL